MGRFEAFAMGNKPWPSFMDALGNSFGYAWILIAVAFFRELLGSGTLWGVQIFGSAIPGEKWGLYTMGYENNNMMILPPMALIIVGVIIWIQRSRNKALIEDH
jgi:Na+-transporting NADH:ubiquinone oxidoreductase subunit D